MKRVIPLALLLSACQFLTPEALALRDFNPLLAEPEELEAGFLLTPGLALPDGGAELVATATRADTGDALTERFVLSQTTEDALTGLMIAEEDHARFASVQARILSWEEEAPNSTTGSVTISARLCETLPGAAQDARLSVWMSEGPGLPMIPMVENLPIAEFVPEDHILRNDDPACAV